jgi:DMSO/TMAO reductase YedYZ molybdopterin-dependent catalytic subunit
VVIFISLVFAHLIVLVIVLGFLWLWRLGPYERLYQTLVAWHWILGLLAAPLLALHAWRRWPAPRKEDLLTRRAFLRVLGVAGIGLAGGTLATWLAGAQAAQGPPRRPVTGSRGFGSFTGNDYPVIGERAPALDLTGWRLVVAGAVRSPLALSYLELLSRPARAMTETIDCTSGWFSIQDWQGVPLIELMEEAGLADPPAGVRLVSVSGYNHTYPLEEARRILLATHASGEVLAPEHGYPLRAVVPGRRGWFWVKWLSRIEVLDSPWEVVGGILASPSQVLRQWN